MRGLGTLVGLCLISMGLGCSRPPARTDAGGPAPDDDAGELPGEDAGPGTTADLVLNEAFVMLPYVEIVNTTAAPLSLDGVVVVVQADRYPLPADRMIDPGSHFVVTDTATRCIMFTATDCLAIAGFHVDPAAALALEVRGVPMESTSYGTSVAAGESWCRVPDASGPFVRCRVTPGRVNEAR